MTVVSGATDTIPLTHKVICIYRLTYWVQSACMTHICPCIVKMRIKIFCCARLSLWASCNTILSTLSRIPQSLGGLVTYLSRVWRADPCSIMPIMYYNGDRQIACNHRLESNMKLFMHSGLTPNLLRARSSNKKIWVLHLKDWASFPSTSFINDTALSLQTQPSCCKLKLLDTSCRLQWQQCQ